MRAFSPASRRGVTLIELMIVAAVLSLLMLVAMPRMAGVVKRAMAARLSHDLTTYANCFRVYSFENGTYPVNNHRTPPPAMAAYLDKSFGGYLPLGGYWNWEGPNYYGFAGVSIDSPVDLWSSEVLAMLDKNIDDGNLDTGNFTWMKHSGEDRRYIYVLEWDVQVGSHYDGHTLPGRGGYSPPGS